MKWSRNRKHLGKCWKNGKMEFIIILLSFNLLLSDQSKKSKCKAFTFFSFIFRQQRKSMTFYPLDDDDEVFQPKSKSTTSPQKSSFTKSSFDDEDTPSATRDNSIKVETRKQEVESRSSNSRLSDWRRDKDDTRVTDRWNKHTEESNNSQTSKPARSWVRITTLLSLQ